jgi:Ca2+-binding RTX toxin-like protein
MAGTIFLDATESAVSEAGGATLQIEIRRAGSLSGDVTILYGVQADSATNGADYTATTGGSVVMLDGQDSVTVPITILDDALDEATEVLTVSLISASGATLTAPRTHRIAILDDETPAPPPPTEPPLVSPYDVTKVVAVNGLDTPVRFAFSPVDPDVVYVAEKAGIVRLANVETGNLGIFLDLRDQVNSAGDRGLLDVVLHPDFVNNPYVYVFYVVDPAGTAGLSGNAGPDGGGNRFSHIVRYTADVANNYLSVVAGSAVTILGAAGQTLSDVSGGGALDFTDPAQSGETASDRISDAGDTVIHGFKQNFLKADSLSHNGGKMLFGPDGMLYVLTGDGTSYNYADPRTPDVQSLDGLSGKVLRIDPLTGQGLADNPFAAGAASLDANQAKVFQLGLRNPFSASFNAEGQLFIADVGWFSYEEINTAGPGANFGWPFYEGVDGGTINQAPGYNGHPDAAAFYAEVAAGTRVITAPFRAFSHDPGAAGFQLNSITSGGIISQAGVYPAALLNDFVFSDFVGGDVYTVDTLDSGSASFLFDWGGGSGPVHMVQGPDGYLYYADLFTGQIGRLEITIAPPPLPQQLETLGSATPIGTSGREYQLTPEAGFRVGGVISSTRIDMRQDAHFRFEMQFGNQDAAGADGGGFTLHNTGPTLLGEAGGGLGQRGLQKALAIEFDTWQNDPSELANDHTVIYAPGNAAFGTGVNGMVDLGNIEDGAWHAIEVRWNATTQTLTTVFDGVQRDTLTADLITEIFDADYAYFLFTAATGGFSLDQRVRNIVADVTYENVAEAQAPVLFGGPERSLTVAENTAAAFGTPRATDAEGDALVWNISGGTDAARFSIDAATGALRFLAVPDFEAPNDANGDNLYRLTIQVTDVGGLFAQQAVTVQVTDVALEDIIGTAAGELLLGRAGNDAMRGLGGADTVRALDGDDVIIATVGDGDDSYHGGAGGADAYSLAETTAAATVNLTSGRASSAETGNDTLRSIEGAIGGSGADSILGSAGANTLAGGEGADTLRGLGGDDSLAGGAGNDRLDGGLDADRMQGGAGDDLYVVDEEDDVVLEAAGGGRDTVQTTVSLTLAENAEVLQLLGVAGLAGTGNAGANVLLGNNGANLLGGEAGADSLSGGSGADTLVGGLGADTLNGGAGADIFVFASAAEGVDKIVGYRGADDGLQVSAAGFGGGLVEGMNLVALGRYAINLTGLSNAPVGTGQFIYERDTFTLHWDADGLGAGAAVAVVQFAGVSGWSGAEITVIA